MKTTKTSKLIKTLLTFGLAAQVQAQSIPTNGLVAFYPLNGNANDASGNGNNGVAENTSATTNQFNQTNSAMGFSGNSWVFIPYSASMATTNFSVSLTFNSQRAFSHFCILRFGAGASPSDFYSGYELADVNSQQNFGFIDFDGQSDYTSGQCVTPIAIWQQGRWYNLTFTQEGTNANLYLNGGLVSSANNVAPYVPAQSSPFYIGANSSGTSDPTATPFDFFNGTICDVRFYNRGLTPDEIQQIYLTEAGPQVSVIKSIRPSFSNLTLGTGYQVLVSSDLSNWTNQGSAFTATDTTFVYPQYFDVSDWNRLFFRLQVAP